VKRKAVRKDRCIAVKIDLQTVDCKGGNSGWNRPDVFPDRVVYCSFEFISGAPGELDDYPHAIITPLDNEYEAAP
jgi:hypothetical protein